MASDPPTSIPSTSRGSLIWNRMLSCWSDNAESNPSRGTQSNREASTPRTGSPAAPLVALSSPTATNAANPAATIVGDVANARPTARGAPSSSARAVVGTEASATAAPMTPVEPPLGGPRPPR